MAVLAHGGEALKFIGDAVLAIFPIDERERGTEEACARAMAAALDAQQRVAGWNEGRAAVGDTALDFGVGLHLGTIMYGNVGTPERLDFTVVGDKVNVTSRIEGLYKILGRSMLFSAEGPTGATSFRSGIIVCAASPRSKKFSPSRRARPTRFQSGPSPDLTKIAGLHGSRRIDRVAEFDVKRWPSSVLQTPSRCNRITVRLARRVAARPNQTEPTGRSSLGTRPRISCPVSGRNQ